MTIFAFLESRYLSVGSVASMRLSSRILPFSTGTLKSTRIRTRFLATGAFLSERMFIKSEDKFVFYIIPDENSSGNRIIDNRQIMVFNAILECTSKFLSMGIKLDEGRDFMEQLKEPLCFEDGLVEAVDRVQALIANQDCVVVGLDGSDVSVGKSTLLSQLALRIDSLHIPVTTCSQIDGIGDNFSTLLAKRTIHNSKKGVIIIEHTGAQVFLTPRALFMIKQNRNSELREELLRLGVHKDQIDLFISIYTANKPFARSKMPDHEPLGDIIICNEKATDKPEIRVF